MTDAGDVPGGRLCENVVMFAQLLRRAGLRVGSGQVMDAVRAMGVVAIHQRDEVFWALHATLVTQRTHHEVFEQAFDLFWRNPFARNEALAMLLPSAQMGEPRPSDTLKRVREAWQPPRSKSAVAPPGPADDTPFDMVMTFSPSEVSRSKDFEQMSNEELRAARSVIQRMDLAVRPMLTRRYRRAEGGAKIDMRRTLKASVKGGGDTIRLCFKRRVGRPPPVVAICDISGSMERYSRLLLSFLHALSHARDHVHAFVFGTRLTNITRALRRRDIDEALASLGREVSDWSGGTRIGCCIRRFNHDWSRRVLSRGAVVILITDGLDRDPEVDLGFEAERLRRSSRRLIWLNPLLRYAGFQPRARGIMQLLPHVDEHRPVHNLHSLEQLARALQ